MMRAFVFIRHGKIAEEWRDKFYGGLDVPLSEDGIKESREVVEVLSHLEGLVRVYSSPLQRALFPASLLAEKVGVELIVDPLLAEIDYGCWAGLPRQEVMSDPLYWERFKDDTLKAPQGESIRDLRNRVKTFWKKLNKLELPGICVIFTHGGFIRALFCELLNLSSKYFFSIEILHLRGMLVIVYEDGNFLIRGVNVLPNEIGKLITFSYW